MPLAPVSRAGSEHPARTRRADIRSSDELGTIGAACGAPRRLHILVAEDNLVNQKLLRALLEREGHRLEFVGTGLAALQAVARERYDLVLMDVQMPEMDGRTAACRIRQLEGETANVPIIALTANAMSGDREAYLAAGMNDYVAKPIDPHELSMAIARAAGRPAAAEPAALLPAASPAPGEGAPDPAQREALARLLREIGALEAGGDGSKSAQAGPRRPPARAQANHQRST